MIPAARELAAALLPIAALHYDKIEYIRWTFLLTSDGVTAPRVYTSSVSCDSILRAVAARWCKGIEQALLRRSGFLVRFPHLLALPLSRVLRACDSSDEDDRPPCFGLTRAALTTLTHAHIPVASTCQSHRPRPDPDPAFPWTLRAAGTRPISPFHPTRRRSTIRCQPCRSCRCTRISNHTHPCHPRDG